MPVRDNTVEVSPLHLSEYLEKAFRKTRYAYKASDVRDLEQEQRVYPQGSPHRRACDLLEDVPAKGDKPGEDVYTITSLHELKREAGKNTAVDVTAGLRHARERLTPVDWEPPEDPVEASRRNEAGAAADAVYYAEELWDTVKDAFADERVNENRLSLPFFPREEERIGWEEDAAEVAAHALSAQELLQEAAVETWHPVDEEPYGDPEVELNPVWEDLQVLAEHSWYMVDYVAQLTGIDQGDVFAAFSLSFDGSG